VNSHLNQLGEDRVAIRGDMKALFDDDDDEPEDAATDNTGLSFNKSYAARFEVRKKKQELARLKEKLKDQEEDDDESSEDEDGKMLTPAMDVQIFRTIDKIRNKDPSIYGQGRFFADGGEDEEADEDEDVDEDEDEDEDEDDKAAAKAPAARPKLTLKQQLLEQGATALVSDDEDEDETAAAKPPRRHKASLVYNEEQQKLREAFLAEAKVAVDDEGEEEATGAAGGGPAKGLRKKAVTKEEREREQQEYASWLRHQLLTEHQGSGAVDDSVTLRRYLYGEQLDANERFLRDYVLNAMWKSPANANAADEDDEDGYDEGGGGVGASDVAARAAKAQAAAGAAGEPGEEEEEDFEDRADDFERKHNFRYEEDGAATLAGHPRHDPSSVRRQAQLSRGREREEAKKARKAEARAQKEAELKRLKNLKKQEILERLRAIEHVTGGAAALTEVDLSGDFDPEAWDKRMAEVFNDDYYEAEDGEWRDGDEEEEDGGVDAAIERDLARAGASGAQWTTKKSGGGGGGGGGGRSGGGGFEAITARLKASGDKSAKRTAQQYMDEYYALDYEDLIGGDLPTRFKYVEVPASGFGITDVEMLAEPEKALAKRVPLRYVKRPFAQLDPSKIKGRANRERWEARKAERTAAMAAEAAMAKPPAWTKKRKRSEDCAGEGAVVTGGEGRKGGASAGGDSGDSGDSEAHEGGAVSRVGSGAGSGAGAIGGADGTGDGEAPAREKKKKKKERAEGNGSPSPDAAGALSKAKSKALKKGVTPERLEMYEKLFRAQKKKKKNDRGKSVVS
jgi:protein KRI1